MQNQNIEIGRHNLLVMCDQVEDNLITEGQPLRKETEKFIEKIYKIREILVNKNDEK